MGDLLEIELERERNHAFIGKKHAVSCTCVPVIFLKHQQTININQ
jgi:hypothetical protein